MIYPLASGPDTLIRKDGRVQSLLDSAILELWRVARKDTLAIAEAVHEAESYIYNRLWYLRNLGHLN